MGEKVCTVCNNLSDYCMYCGGTIETKHKRGFKVCPSCNNQSDYCMTCGGNVKLQRSQDDGDEDDY